MGCDRDGERYNSAVCNTVITVGDSFVRKIENFLKETLIEFQSHGLFLKWSWLKNKKSRNAIRNALLIGARHILGLGCGS